MRVVGRFDIILFAFCEEAPWQKCAPALSSGQNQSQPVPFQAFHLLGDVTDSALCHDVGCTNINITPVTRS